MSVVPNLRWQSYVRAVLHNASFSYGARLAHAIDNPLQILTNTLYLARTSDQYGEEVALAHARRTCAASDRLGRQDPGARIGCRCVRGRRKTSCPAERHGMLALHETNPQQT